MVPASAVLPSAKLDAPTLMSVQPFQPNCVAVAWDVARSSAYIEQQCELRYRRDKELAWTLVRAPCRLAGPAVLRGRGEGGSTALLPLGAGLRVEIPALCPLGL